LLCCAAWLLSGSSFVHRTFYEYESITRTFDIRKDVNINSH
jgi:hypothetical protein